MRVTVYDPRLRSDPQFPYFARYIHRFFAYPSVQEIVTCQQRLSGCLGPLPAERSPILVEGKKWLPLDADQLIMLVFIVAHRGMRGPRGAHVMVNIIKREFMIDNLQRKCKNL